MKYLAALGLRWRLGLAGTAAVAVVVTLVALLGYMAVRRDLVSDVDKQLRAGYVTSQRAAMRRSSSGGTGMLSRNGILVQYVAASGSRANTPTDGPVLPVDSRTRAVATGTDRQFLSDVDSGGVHLRVLTAPSARGGAVQLALPMTSVDGELNRLETMLVWVGLAGLLVAMGLNWLVGRAVLGPVGRLTRVSERVSSTMDLSQRMEAVGPDELRRLAHSFNAMLDAVGEAVDAQRQLVADASHELRTPLTSLRTNVELLARAEQMPAGDRARLVGRIDAGLAELSGLVNDIVDLARGEEGGDLVAYVNLDALVREAVGRAAGHWPAVAFRVDLDAVLVRGVAERVARAVANLLDNAAKFSPVGGRVDVSLRTAGGGALLAVRDHGSGVAGADLERVFDRFYRAPDARKVPGAGLGLAIVGQVARSHGGWAKLEPAEGGGTRALLWLPPAAGGEAGAGPGVATLAQ